MRFPFPPLFPPLPLGIHLQGIEDVCILANDDVYTSALSAFGLGLGLFIHVHARLEMRGN
jgi:hypothetical protein